MDFVDQDKTEDTKTKQRAGQPVAAGANSQQGTCSVPNLPSSPNKPASSVHDAATMRKVLIASCHLDKTVLVLYVGLL